MPGDAPSDVAAEYYLSIPTHIPPVSFDGGVPSFPASPQNQHREMPSPAEDYEYNPYEDPWSPEKNKSLKIEKTPPPTKPLNLPGPGGSKKKRPSRYAVPAPSAGAAGFKRYSPQDAPLSRPSTGLPPQRSRSSSQEASSSPRPVTASGLVGNTPGSPPNPSPPASQTASSSLKHRGSLFSRLGHSLSRKSDGSNVSSQSQPPQTATATATPGMVQSPLPMNDNVLSPSGAPIGLASPRGGAETPGRRKFAIPQTLEEWEAFNRAMLESAARPKPPPPMQGGRLRPPSFQGTPGTRTPGSNDTSLPSTPKRTPSMGTKELPAPPIMLSEWEKKFLAQRIGTPINFPTSLQPLSPRSGPSTLQTPNQKSMRPLSQITSDNLLVDDRPPLHSRATTTGDSTGNTLSQDPSQPLSPNSDLSNRHRAVSLPEVSQAAMPDNGTPPSARPALTPIVTDVSSPSLGWGRKKPDAAAKKEVDRERKLSATDGGAVSQDGRSQPGPPKRRESSLNRNLLMKRNRSSMDVTTAINAPVGQSLQQPIATNLNNSQVSLSGQETVSKSKRNSWGLSFGRRSRQNSSDNLHQSSVAQGAATAQTQQGNVVPPLETAPAPPPARCDPSFQVQLPLTDPVPAPTPALRPQQPEVAHPALQAKSKRNSFTLGFKSKKETPSPSPTPSPAPPLLPASSAVVPGTSSSGSSSESFEVQRPLADPTPAPSQVSAALEASTAAQDAPTPASAFASGSSRRLSALLKMGTAAMKREASGDSIATPPSTQQLSAPARNPSPPQDEDVHPSLRPKNKRRLSFGLGSKTKESDPIAPPAPQTRGSPAQDEDFHPALQPKSKRRLSLVFGKSGSESDDKNAGPVSGLMNNAAARESAAVLPAPTSTATVCSASSVDAHPHASEPSVDQNAEEVHPALRPRTRKFSFGFGRNGGGAPDKTKKTDIQSNTLASQSSAALVANPAIIPRTASGDNVPAAGAATQGSELSNDIHPALRPKTRRFSFGLGKGAGQDGRRESFVMANGSALESSTTVLEPNGPSLTPASTVDVGTDSSDAVQPGSLRKSKRLSGLFGLGLKSRTTSADEVPNIETSVLDINAATESPMQQQIDQPGASNSPEQPDRPQSPVDTTEDWVEIPASIGGKFIPSIGMPGSPSLRALDVTPSPRTQVREIEAAIQREREEQANQPPPTLRQRVSSLFRKPSGDEVERKMEKERGLLEGPCSSMLGSEWAKGYRPPSPPPMPSPQDLASDRSLPAGQFRSRSRRPSFSDAAAAALSSFRKPAPPLEDTKSRVSRFFKDDTETGVDVAEAKAPSLQVDESSGERWSEDLINDMGSIVPTTPGLTPAELVKAVALGKPEQQGSVVRQDSGYGSTDTSPGPTAGFEY